MGTEQDASADACPYVGLQPYREEDRAYFFGRERDIEAVIDNLYAARLTVYYGASGVGKSSVLMAGVVPALRCEPRTAVVVFREWQLESAVTRLKQLIVEAVARAGGATGSLDAGTQLDDLLKQAGEAINGTVLLLLDQFEEYFLYHPDSGESSFDAELARAVTRRDVDAGFLLSLREDALAKLDRFKTGIPNLLANRLRLEHLDRSAAEQAVRKPLERFASLPEAQGKPSRIEDALVERVIAETASGRVSLAQGAGAAAAAAAADDMHVETPFLQLVLTRLWRAELSHGSAILRLQTLVDLGGAKNIVESHLDDVMDKLSAEDQEICSRFFDRLVTPSGGKIACRLDDLTNWAGPSLAARVPSALARLAQDRILRPVSGLPGQPPQYEIFHDVLAASILKWRDDFLKQTRQTAEQEQALAAERQQRLEAEARAGRILKWASACVVVLLVVAAVGWYRADAEGGRLAISQFAAKANAAAAREPRTAAYFAVLAARDAQASAQVRRALYAALSVPIPTEFSACRASATVGGKILRFGSLRSERPDQLGPTQPAIGLGCEDGVLRFYPQSGPMRGLGAAANAIKHLALSPDGARAVALHDYGEVRVWDLSNPQAVAYKLPEVAQQFSVDDDARFMVTVELLPRQASGKSWHRVRVRDSRLIRDATKGLIDEFAAEDVEDVAISNDGAWLALRTSGGDLLLCKRPGCSQKRRVSGRSVGGFGGILFTPQRRLIATGGEDEGKLHIFNPAAAGDMHEEALPSQSGLEGVYLAKDGRVAAVAESVRVWSPEHGLSNPAATAVGDFALSTDMRFAAIAGEAGITLWDYAAHRTLATLPARATSYRDLEFSPDGQTLAVLLDRGDEESILQLWRLAELGAARTLPASGKKIEEVEFARDGSLLLATQWDASTWDISSGDRIHTVRGEAPADEPDKSPWTDVAVSAESMRLAAVTRGRPGVELWDMRSGERLPMPELAQSSATDVRLDADGKVLAVGEADGRVSFFRVGRDERRKIGEIPANGKKVKRVAFGSKSHIAVTFVDNPIDRIEVWSVERQPRKLFPSPGDAGKAQHLAFSPDGTRIAVSVADSVTLRRLDPPAELASVRLDLELGGPVKETNQPEKAEERTREKIRRLAFSEDSRILALGGAQGHVVLWRVPGTEARFFVRLGKRAQQGEIHTLAFSPDSKTILTTSGDDPTAKLWDTQTGEELQVLFSGDAAFTRATFGEGKYLAAGRADGSVRLYPLELGELVRVAKDRLRMQPYTPEECRKHLEEECPALQ